MLALYSPNYETVVSADALSYGLGAVLTQRQPDTGLFRPVVYLSRSLTDTERRYSQIEKEALATTWACERLSNYLIGLPFTVETDHKPLVPLLGTKALDELPPRVLRFRLRLMRYQFNIVHVPGKNLITADALSRAPADVSSGADSALEQEVDAFMAAVTDGLPATDQPGCKKFSQRNKTTRSVRPSEATAPSGGLLKVVFQLHSNLTGLIAATSVPLQTASFCLASGSLFQLPFVYKSWTRFTLDTKV